ncbi:hypothetical protein A2U01_0066690, partial [Trifolium medium]|nr:hypothetical protein [Trifolium medium]
MIWRCPHEGVLVKIFTMFVKVLISSLWSATVWNHEEGLALVTTLMHSYDV